MGHYVKAISQRTSLTCLIETFELSNHWKLWFSSRSFPPAPSLSLSLSLLFSCDYCDSLKYDILFVQSMGNL